MNNNNNKRCIQSSVLKHNGAQSFSILLSNFDVISFAMYVHVCCACVSMSCVWVWYCGVLILWYFPLFQ